MEAIRTFNVTDPINRKWIVLIAQKYVKVQYRSSERVVTFACLWRDIWSITARGRTLRVKIGVAKTILEFDFSSRRQANEALKFAVRNRFIEKVPLTLFGYMRMANRRKYKPIVFTGEKFQYFKEEYIF